MDSEPVIIVLGALGAVLGALAHAPIPYPWNLAAGAASLGLAGFVMRAKVSPVGKIPPPPPRSQTDVQSDVEVSKR